MQNPFQTFTDAISKKIPFSDNKFLSSIEFKKPDFLSYIINQPIYANKELLKDYFELIEYL